jgi:hypothetical protein
METRRTIFEVPVGLFWQTNGSKAMLLAPIYDHPEMPPGFSQKINNIFL